MTLTIPWPTTLWRRLRRRASSRADRAESVAPERTPFTEEFRLLALNVMAILDGSPDKMITVFSADPGEGRSVVARNLALALAEHREVLLADSSSANPQKLLPSDRVAGLLPSNADAAEIPNS